MTVARATAAALVHAGITLTVLVSMLALAPSANACCHLYDDPEGHAVGLCVAGWRNDALHADVEVYAHCSAAGNDVVVESAPWETVDCVLNPKCL